MNKGQLIVVSGPSGSGKDTVISKAIERLGEKAFLSVSMTTRSKRGSETDGVDYYFVSEAQFHEHIANGDMLEYAKYGSNYYGTPAQPIKERISNGETVFLNIEVQGGASVRKLMPEAVKIFILPPSVRELERRLRKRATEDEEAIQKRLLIAEDEIRRAVEYDYIVINDDLDDAVDALISIVKGHTPKNDNIKEMISEVLSHV
ncbi:MAG: guanylate kinase [Acutalibacteraceae bacterium]